MRKGKIISIVSRAVLLVALIIAVVCFFGEKYQYFYTQIDNTKYQTTIDADRTLYEYKLDSYDKTVRELRGGAFLKLKYTNPGGVVTWEEVQWTELPEAVKGIYPQ